MTNEDELQYCDRIGVADLECATNALKAQPSDIDCTICAQLQLALAMNLLFQSIRDNVYNFNINRV